MTEWRFISRCLNRHKVKLEQKIHSREQMLKIKCFLAWRSYVRYEQSELSQLDGHGGTKSAISYLDIIESYDATGGVNTAGSRSYM